MKISTPWLQFLLTCCALLLAEVRAAISQGVAMQQAIADCAQSEPGK